MSRSASHSHARSLALSDVEDELVRRVEDAKSRLRRNLSSYNVGCYNTLSELLEWVRTHE